MMNHNAGYCHSQLKYYATLGGTGLKAAIRKILHRLGTNSVWSKFSLKGRLNKYSLQELGLAEFIMRELNLFK